MMARQTYPNRAQFLWAVRVGHCCCKAKQSTGDRVVKRILIRAGKTPDQVFSAHETLDKNPIGNNSGNLMFAAAAHKLLSASDTEVVPTTLNYGPWTADRVNEEFDAFVLPLANAFRPKFEAELLTITRLIEKLKIPVIMLSGGAQLGLDGNGSELAHMEDTIKRFGRAVLERSSQLSVRGETTRKYLNSLGFNDVVTIGCPSMCLWGPDHQVQKPTDVLEEDAPVAYNVETGRDFLQGFVDFNEDRHPLTYVGQDRKTLEMMLWGRDAFAKGRDPRLPLSVEHKQFTSGTARFYLDSYRWIEEMKSVDYSIGPRIHGNIASVLAGTPATVIAHDSRTAELSDYHGIPYKYAHEITDTTDIAELYAEADFTKFNSGQAERFNRVASFLAENDLPNIFDGDQTGALAKYEDRIAKIEFPPAVIPVSARLEGEELDRIARLRQKSVALERQLKVLTEQAAQQKKATDERVGALEKQINALTGSGSDGAQNSFESGAANLKSTFRKVFNR